MPVTNKQLSEREQEILRLVATGASNKEIAKELYISTNTVKVHLRNIFAKIGVNSRTEAAMYAVNTGLIIGSQQAVEYPEGESTVASPMQRKIDAPVIVLIIIVIAMGLSFLSISLWQSARSTPVDPASGEESERWQTLSPMLTPRSGMAVAGFGNWIYTFAGASEQGVTDVAERFDPEADTWEIITSKPTAVVYVSAAVIGGKIYVPGGCLDSGEPTNIMEIYDPVHDRWELGTNLPQPLSSYALATFEGRFYLFGGWNGQKFIDTVYEYDPDQETWGLRTPMRIPRGYAGAAVSGDGIHVIGGYDGKQALSAHDVYRPHLEENHSESAWELDEPLPFGRYSAGVVSLADVIYVIGGQDDPRIQMKYLSYNPGEGEWRMIETSKPPLGAYLGLVPMLTRLYAIGGSREGMPLDQNLVYQVIYSITIPILPIGEQ